PNNVTYITLSEPWTGRTKSVTSWMAYPDTYELPTDFIRGTSPLFIMAFPASGFPYTIDVIDPPDLERYYPQTYPMAAGRTQSGRAVGAARVTETKLRFSHYLYTPDTPYPVQIEFEYIRRPDVLAEGAIPMVPIQHRRILSYGLAYLILADKDDSSATPVWQQFQAQWKAMMDEYRRGLRRMSSRWGVVQPSRVTQAWGPPLWTSGGLPGWAWENTELGVARRNGATGYTLFDTIRDFWNGCSPEPLAGEGGRDPAGRERGRGERSAQQGARSHVLRPERLHSSAILRQLGAGCDPVHHDGALVRCHSHRERHGQFHRHGSDHTAADVGIDHHREPSSRGHHPRRAPQFDRGWARHCRDGQRGECLHEGPRLYADVRHLSRADLAQCRHDRPQSERSVDRDARRRDAERQLHRQHHRW